MNGHKEAKGNQYQHQAFVKQAFPDATADNVATVEVVKIAIRYLGLDYFDLIMLNNGGSQWSSG